MEKSTNSISWLHGLEDFFRFKKQDHIANDCEKFLKVMYSENKAATLRNVIVDSLPENMDFQTVSNVINFFSHTANSESNMKLYEISSALSNLYPDEIIFQNIKKFYRETDLDLADVFSRGQVHSKIWLVNELSKIKKDFDCVYVLAGWFGQLRQFMDIAGIDYKKMRIIDIDPNACKVSDQVFNVDAIEKYKVKSVELDLTNMSWLFRTGGQYKIKNYTTDSTVNEKSIPDLVINTSAEHFHESWYHKFVNRPQTTDPLFVIQSNNLHDIPDHINSIHSISEMKKKFPMSRIEFEGELQLQGYKRYMLIGRP